MGLMNFIQILILSFLPLLTLNFSVSFDKNFSVSTSVLIFLHHFFWQSTDDMKSIAVEAALLLQGKINDEDDNTVTIRLLVPSKVIGCIIGKSGSIINEIRKRTKADVRISKGEKPKCADSTDELVEVVGEVSRVRDALIQIVLRLRDDVLKDREVLPSVPPVAPMGYEQRTESGSGLGMLSSGSLYGYGSLSKVVQISCGWRHTLAFTERKNVFSWGRGTNGQLGHGESVDR
ncbi:KH domain-containing protein At4g18375-like isoform X2 [Camellia sinensis]|uniref:KH domain-containing protein At4g18375-like isoform X2 n=1 Tax=Camellia sinensis TaxID=4442 RepID=UPI0010364538|nr:KH domain-containing protein At4g18375-like isoform X2 [Camellia sinensis]